jgi:glucose-1-phosphate cytidylyltransferase
MIDTAVVLCGGRGTRLQEHTQAIPKPLVEVGGLPIVWHVVSIFAAQGIERVLLLTGYKSDLMAAFAASADWSRGVRVQCVDTGTATTASGPAWTPTRTRYG